MRLVTLNDNFKSCRVGYPFTQQHIHIQSICTRLGTKQWYRNSRVSFIFSALLWAVAALKKSWFRMIPINFSTWGVEESVQSTASEWWDEASSVVHSLRPVRGLYLTCSYYGPYFPANWSSALYLPAKKLLFCFPNLPLCSVANPEAYLRTQQPTGDFFATWIVVMHGLRYPLWYKKGVGEHAQKRFIFL